MLKKKSVFLVQDGKHDDDKILSFLWTGVGSAWGRAKDAVFVFFLNVKIFNFFFSLLTIKVVTHIFGWCMSGVRAESVVHVWSMAHVWSVAHVWLVAHVWSVAPPPTPTPSHLGCRTGYLSS